MSGRAPAFVWSGRPVYRCQVCGPHFERVENLAAVERHEAEQHAPPAPIVRESPILGEHGRPLLMIEGA
jgi:hypothetical protein